MNPMIKKLRGIRGNESTLLESAGFRDIYDAKRQWGGTKKGTAKEIYKFLLESYNDEVDNLRKERIADERRAKKEANAIKKIKSDVKQVNTQEQLYKIVKHSFQTKTQFSYKFITERGTVLRDFNFKPLDTLSKTWTHMLLAGVQENSEWTLFTIYNGKPNEYTEGEVGHAFIQYGKKIVPSDKIHQSFFDGKINCVMTPILNFIDEKLNDVKTKQAKYNYTSMKKKAVELEKKYHDVGVNKDAMVEISNTLQIDIHIHLPFQKDFIVSKSNKKALRTFQYRNTRLNHVDFDELTHNEIEEIVTLEELINIQKKLDLAGTYYTYQKSFKNITQIDTLNRRYKLTNKYRDCIYYFETEVTGLIDCKICSIQQPELCAFVRQGNHFNETIGADPEFQEISDDVTHDGHIDMRKAYTNYKLCKYYKGFLGKITDFRACNCIVDIGIYQIKNLVLVGRIKAWNDKLNCYNDNVYPSPELEMLLAEGCTFDIIAGCWGSSIDFVFNDELLNGRDYLGKDNNGKDMYDTRYYCKYVGQMYCSNLEHSYYMKADEKFMQHLRNEIDTEITTFDKEVKVSYPKSTNYQLPHISAFILSYTRMNVIEQLFEFEMKNVVKIVVDGIYFNGPCPELKNCFRNEDKKMVSCVGDCYISNRECGEFTYGKFREHNLIEVHTGAGGCGKTHHNLVDDGFIGLTYFAPSWKLARTKQKEYGCQVNTIAKLLSSDPETLGYIKRYLRVALIDECSMLSDKDKNIIIKNLDGCKIIFCGDFGFQLPCFETDKDGNKLAPFNTKGMIIKEHNTNYRVKCEKLNQLLRDIREMMVYEQNPRSLIEQVCSKGNIADYDYLNDLIITQTHVEKNRFTDLFSHLNKYYITQSDRVYGRGEICFEKPDTKNYVIQHAFTVHSIQGETALGKLYIDFNKMYNPQMLYTAISRAKYLHQISLI